MGSIAENVTAPRAVADATARTGVQQVSATSTSTSVVLPTTGKLPGKQSTIGGRWIELLAVGANVQWAEGHGAAPTLVYNQASAVGTGHASRGATIINSVSKQVMISSEATHLAFICNTGESATVEFYVSDQPIV